MTALFAIFGATSFAQQSIGQPSIGRKAFVQQVSEKESRAMKPSNEAEQIVAKCRKDSVCWTFNIFGFLPVGKMTYDIMAWSRIFIGICRIWQSDILQCLLWVPNLIWPVCRRRMTLSALLLCQGALESSFSVLFSNFLLNILEDKSTAWGLKNKEIT